MFHDTQKGIWNVGGSEAVTLYRLAQRIIEKLELDLEIFVEGNVSSPELADYYVANTKRANELNVGNKFRWTPQSPRRSIGSKEIIKHDFCCQFAPQHLPIRFMI